MNTSASKIPPITMSKLYIGNLPSDMNEAGLRQLFIEQNLSCTNILVKRGGYAFVECPDQSSADKAIDKLNGKLLYPIGVTGTCVIRDLSRILSCVNRIPDWNYLSNPCTHDYDSYAIITSSIIHLCIDSLFIVWSSPLFFASCFAEHFLLYLFPHPPNLNIQNLTKQIISIIKLH